MARLGVERGVGRTSGFGMIVAANDGGRREGTRVGTREVESGSVMLVDATAVGRWLGEVSGRGVVRYFRYAVDPTGRKRCNRRASQRVGRLTQPPSASACWPSPPPCSPTRVRASLTSATRCSVLDCPCPVCASSDASRGEMAGRSDDGGTRGERRPRGARGGVECTRAVRPSLNNWPCAQSTVQSSEGGTTSKRAPCRRGR